jgi:hypothetical protein
VNGAFLHILAESEPFWKHPAVVVLLIIIALTIVCSILGAVLKLIGVSLLTIVFWPIMRRTGRYLFLGTVLAVVASPLYKGRLEELIRPEITAVDALAQVNDVLGDADALKAHLRFGTWDDPAAPVTVALDGVADAAGRLKGLRGSAAWKTVGPSADRALASLDTVINLGKELRDARTELENASDAFGRAYETVRVATSVENVNALTERADALRDALRREHRILREMRHGVPQVLADLKGARTEMASVPSAAALLSAPITLLDELADPLEKLTDNTREARRQARDVYKIGHRHTVVEKLSAPKEHAPPDETTSGSVGVYDAGRDFTRAGAGS